MKVGDRLFFSAELTVNQVIEFGVTIRDAEGGKMLSFRVRPSGRTQGLRYSRETGRVKLDALKAVGNKLDLVFQALSPGIFEIVIFGLGNLGSMQSEPMVITVTQ